MRHLSFLILFVGCVESPELDFREDFRVEEGCVPGASAACACPDGAQGAQSCQEDGTFRACVCEPDAAPDALEDGAPAVDAEVEAGAQAPDSVAPDAVLDARAADAAADRGAEDARVEDAKADLALVDAEADAEVDACAPTDEICDEQDNDCDGRVDEEADPGLCPAPASVEGACHGGRCSYACRGDRFDLDQDPLNGCEWSCEGLPLIGQLVGGGAVDFAMSVAHDPSFAYTTGQALRFTQPLALMEWNVAMGSYGPPAVGWLGGEAWAVAARNIDTDLIEVYVVRPAAGVEGPVTYGESPSDPAFAETPAGVTMGWLAQPTAMEQGGLERPAPTYGYWVTLSDRMAPQVARNRLGAGGFLSTKLAPLVKTHRDRILFVAPDVAGAQLHIVDFQVEGGQSREAAGQLPLGVAPVYLGGDRWGDNLVVTHGTRLGVRQLLLQLEDEAAPVVRRDVELEVGATTHMGALGDELGVTLYGRAAGGPGVTVFSDGNALGAGPVEFVATTERVRVARGDDGPVVAWITDAGRLVYREAAPCQDARRP